MKNFSRIRRRFLATVQNEKGGVGKTTVAAAFVDHLALNGVAHVIFQVDEQQRLAKLVGSHVTTILPSLAEARRDPRRLMAVFSPIYEACAKISQGGPAVVVDVGANQFAHFSAWLKAVDLNEDLDEWKVPALAFVPAVAEPEALRQAASTLVRIESVLPVARRVFVENQRNGAIADLSPRSEAAEVVETALAPALKECRRLIMPLIEGASWQPFENASIRFIRAIAMRPDEAAPLIGEDVANAKVMRSDVARFFKAMQTQFEELFDFSNGGTK